MVCCLTCCQKVKQYDKIEIDGNTKFRYYNTCIPVHNVIDKLNKWFLNIFVCKKVSIDGNKTYNKSDFTRKVEQYLDCL